MSSLSSSTRKENDSSFLSTIKKIYTEYEYLETDKFQLVSEKLYQLWMKSIMNKNLEGYSIIDYLEQLIINNKMNDNFFILIINTLSKNNQFYQVLLNNHQRFKKLFDLSIRKPVCLMRYLELLYYYCPMHLVSDVGLKFYRFIVENYFMKYFRETSNDIDSLSIFSSLIYQFYENSVKNSMTTELIFNNQKDAIDYSIYVINTLLFHRLKIKSNKDLLFDMKLISTIIKAIGTVWEQNSTKENQDVQTRSIEHLFDTMSTQKSPQIYVSTSTNNFKTSFSPAILPLFSRIQLDLADTTLKSMFSDGRLNGERICTMTKSLIELIDAPNPLIENTPYDTWIIGLCTALVTFKQHDYLRKLLDETTMFLIDHLFNNQTYENAFQILFWYIRYDKRIQTFRFILDRLPNLFEYIQKHSNEDFKTKIIELCHIGVAIHSEYDISNEIILKQILQNHPQPDLNILSNHKTIHTRFHSNLSDNDVENNHNHNQKIPNRSGIINLGNTCYVNSVLQALYHCDLFQKYILEHYFNQEIVLKELQILFAQLKLSKRPYINAINLVKVARPAWFAINEQQDCAEFLGYLLDTIKDEEKKERNLSSYEIERLFTIHTCQINRCQTCLIESYREESSNYLFLPIPTSDNQNKNMNSNQSASPITLLKNGLQFYLSTNINSLSNDQSNHLNRSSIPKIPSNISIQSPSPPSYNSIINNSLNLQSVFDYYFQKEELKGENQYRCEHCRYVPSFLHFQQKKRLNLIQLSSLQDAERYIILQTAPEYLILSLNRFEYDKTTNIFRKIFTKMNYPKILNVPIYPSKTSRTNSILIKYSLILIIVHTGYTLHSGHYYVYAREIKSSSSKINLNEQDDGFSNDEWFLLNDEHVTLSSYEAIIENCAQYTSATPYILFYKRIDQQRIQDIERIKQINVHESLIKQIQEDNVNYEREQGK